MARYAGVSADLRRWWQRHPWAGLSCGWLVIGAVALGVSRFWGVAHA